MRREADIPGMHAADTFVSEDSERDEYGRTNPSGSFKCRLSRLQARFQRKAILCFLMQSLIWLRNWIRKYMQPYMLVAPFWAPLRSPDNKEEETTRLMHFMNVRWAQRQNKNQGVRMNGCDTMSTVSGCWRWNEGSTKEKKKKKMGLTGQNRANRLSLTAKFGH